MRNLADLTLDELVDSLIGGEALQVAGGDTFKIAAADSQAALAFYNQDRRSYWNPEKDTAIQESEIDRLLDSLDRPIKARAAVTRLAPSMQRWRLTKVAAHRFRGLHRHCADNGSDPDEFEFEVQADATLLRGFNGAGKTSLVTAVCWCLTGYGYRSQALPAPLHESIKVQFAQLQDGGDGNDGFELPPIVPIPTEHELVLVDGAAKHDTWVRLTFVSLIDGREALVERHLERSGRKGFTTRAVGLERLGLSDLALQVGSLMPGIAAATRFDDKTTLSQAVSTLTGLRPLAHFGTRSARVHDRLIDKYPKEAKKAKDDARDTVSKQIQTLHDLLKGTEGLPDLACVVLPADDTPDAWEHGLQEADTNLKAVEETSAADATLILGALPSLATENDIKRFADQLAAARNQFTNVALKGLPSIQTAQRLGSLTEAVARAAEGVLSEIETEARTLVERLSDADRANRLRLYGLVARWHEAAHPGHPFNACPVCTRGLTAPGAIPMDALLDQSVAEALEASRAADAALLMTAVEWERTTAQKFRGMLPANLQGFVDEEVPDTLAALYKTALSVEVFAQSDFPAAFRKLAASVAHVCTAAWKDALADQPLPAFGLPAEIPDKEGLRAAAVRIQRAIRLARYRAAHGEFAKTAMREVLEAEPKDASISANHRSVAAQFRLLETYLESARTFAGIRRQLAQIKDTCGKWKKSHERIGKLARAAEAVKVFTEFPKLVHDQVGGLIADLESQASAWAQRMYKAQFVQAPSYAGFDAERTDGLNFLASQGNHLVEAHHIMNASALRVYLSAFVLALWQQIWSRSGGISTVLMDDPQDLLDPGNVANLAATVPHLLDAGIHPLIVSNDFGFIPTIESFVAAHPTIGSAKRTGVWEFSAISRSKCTASLAPVADEVRERRDRWKADPNDVALARAFVHPVRVRIEMKLWDLLGSDPAVLKDPTLNDLLGKIANARNRGEAPFNEQPFCNLLELPPLNGGAPFREAINKAHHGKADQISPAEAEVVDAHYDDVFSTIDACWLSYARFMGRLPPEDAVPANEIAPPAAVPFPDRPIPVIGRLAARESGAALATVEDAAERFSLASLGPVALFTLRAPTLGLVAFPGQTLIVLPGAEVKNGDIAIVQTARKTYARRIGIDKSDLSRIVLEAMPSTNPRVPPTHFLSTHRHVLAESRRRALRRGHRSEVAGRGGRHRALADS
jgi:AAA domain-containing protein